MLLFVSATQVLAFGAWVRAPKKYYTAVAFGYYQAGDFFNRKGMRKNLVIVRDPTNPASIFFGRENSTYRQYEGGLYLEYGLGKNLELSTNFAFHVVAQQDSDIGLFEANGIRDATVALKYKWFEWSWLLSSIQLEVGIPMGDEKAQGIVAGQAPQPIPLGDNEWDYAFRLYLGHSFYPLPVYVTADFCYRIRTSGSNGADFADDYPWSIESGYTLSLSEKSWFRSITTMVALRGLISTKERQAIGFGSIDVTGFSSNQESLVVQFGVAFSIFKNLTLGTSYTHNLTGKNSGAGWGIRYGISLQN